MKTTKYRIRITTFKNGRKEYFAQVKNFFGWIGIGVGGDAGIYNLPDDSRKDALNRIDKHYAGNNTKQTIEFEYIDK